MAVPYGRRIAPLLVALILAAVALRALVLGNYCLVPSAALSPGQAPTAETSVYGFVLYRGVGVDQQTMYREAVWWYEAALLAEWTIAVAAGVSVYLLLRLWRAVRPQVLLPLKRAVPR
jgi:hypothetical protein